MGNNAAYLVAVVVAILYTLRKLELRKLTPSHFPGVPEREFEAWQAQEAGCYNLISLSCLLMIVADLGWRWFAGWAAPSWRVVQLVGAGIFFAWVGVLVFGLMRARAARRMGRELGIQPGGTITAEKRP
jgi:hypothetical protein